MTTDGRSPALIDTSVLLNFLAVDRAVLLDRHPRFRFVITDHVQGEVTDRRPERQARFETALRDKLFDLLSVSDPEALAVFGNLLAEGRLDIGESAAAAMAIVQSHPLATDDKRAKKILARLHPELVIIDTASIIRDLILANVLSVDEANAIKVDLEANHRFKMSFERFE